MVIWVIETFLYSSSVYFCHLFLISSYSVRSLPFLSFILSILAAVPLISRVFLRSLVFSILLFSSVSLHCSFKKAFLSLLAILWNSALCWVYLSLFPLAFASLLSSAIYKAFSGNHFAFLHFFFFWMVLVIDSQPIPMLKTPIHSSSGTLSTRSNPLNIFVTSTV